MSSALKHLYHTAFIDQFCLSAAQALPDFKTSNFKKLVFNDEWEQLELKGRMRHIARSLHPFMPKEFPQAAPLLRKLVDTLLSNKMTGYSLEFMFLPDYVELYGINNLKEACKTMEHLTQFSSCEFAVRPFILKYPEQMSQQMLQWSLHSNHHIRRFASEGIRPRLPWAMALPFLKKDPGPILPILDNLKEDESEYVRRSVANNLNDISKDNPHVFMQIAKKWKSNHPFTQEIIKHGARTLLKAANPEIIKHYGLHKRDHLSIENFQIQKNKIPWGGTLQFTFALTNKSAKSASVRLEYAVHFLRKNETHSKKVFKISERNLAAKESISLLRNHSFKAITTRVYYPGLQKIELIVNGSSYGILDFHLKAEK